VEAGLAGLGAQDPVLRALARAIRIGHGIYRPDRVVLLGGVGRRLAGQAAALRELVSDRLTSVARAEWVLAFGVDDHHAARGAARSGAAARLSCKGL
jgi:hypothetical protein